jgi:maltose 6'-phosphate phosphatase
MMRNYGHPNGPQEWCGGSHARASFVRHHTEVTRRQGNTPMKASVARFTVLVVCSMVICLPRLSIGDAPGGNVRCPDVSQRGVLNILTINILFSEVEHRTARLDRLATFVRSQFEAGQPVDVILLQEAAGGRLVQTENSAHDLQEILNHRYALDYRLRTAYASGVPGLLTVFNATLSRCAITASLWTLLPPATELEFQGHQIALSRSVLMTRLQVPDVGYIHVYNTHLCAYCAAAERLEQAQRLVRFVQRVETLAPGTHPIILGGDFNTDLTHADSQEEALYRLFTAESPFPFQDAYAVAHGAGNPASLLWCVRREDGGIDLPEGCTFGVTPIRDPLGGALEPARIDRGLQDIPRANGP